MQKSEPAARQAKNPDSKAIKNSSFRELFSAQEIGYYGAAVLVYIALGLAFRDKVLNIGVGPLFFIVWVWVVPPLWERLVKRVGER